MMQMFKYPQGEGGPTTIGVVKESFLLCRAMNR